MQEVKHELAKKITVRPAVKNSEVILEVDGELPGQLPASFQVVPQALRIRCPK
jgi:diacylglycerol kinase family enzyme